MPTGRNECRLGCLAAQVVRLSQFACSAANQHRHAAASAYYSQTSVGPDCLLPLLSPSADQPGHLCSVVEAAEALEGASLRHVFTMEGGKWYG